MPTISTKAKEAIKTALAMVLAYGIAMWMGWPNPYWAAFAVAMISLPTAGQSLLKGALRMGGTLLGCTAGVAILALAPQERWLFMLLISGWVFLMTYQMTGSRRSYFWHVSGFVCLIITLSGTTGSVNPFLDAMARTYDTALGILVYTLITVFIWPRSNAGAVKQAARDLLATQGRLLRFCGDRLARNATGEDGMALRTQQVKQLNQLNQALLAEGSERYEVHALRRRWTELAALSSALMGAIDRWYLGFAEFSHLDMRRILPNYEANLAELERRLEQVRVMLAGEAAVPPAQAIALAIDASERTKLSHLDHAAIAVMRQEVEKIDNQTRSLLACVRELTGGGTDVRRSGAETPFGAKRGGFSWPVPDLDRAWRATFAATTTAVGFLIWIFFDPPGHASMYQLPGTIAMAVAATPQIRASRFLKPFAVAMLLGLGVYVFVLPRLTNFAELAVPLFVFTFVTCYFFTGIARLAGLVAMINMVSVQNQQTYSFAAMANAYVFTLMGFTLVFVVSYMIGSARPEKVFMRLLRRFFDSAAALMAHPPAGSASSSAASVSWRTAFHLKQLQGMSDRLAAWGHAIDFKKFPDIAPEQVEKLVTRVRAMIYRIEAWLDAARAPQSEALVKAMAEEVGDWRGGIEKIYLAYARMTPVSAGDLRERLKSGLTAVETRLNATLDRTGAGQFIERDSEAFYRRLGGCRGVSEEVAAYAGATEEMNWAHWREERF